MSNFNNILLGLPFIKRLYPSLLRRYLVKTGKNRGLFRIDQFDMYLDFLDPIDREIILRQKFEHKQCELLISLILKNNVDSFIDVGANCGYYSFYLASKLPSLQIYAFEPLSEAYTKFENTIVANKEIFSKIKLHKYGLSNENSSLTMVAASKHNYVKTGGARVVEDDYRLKPNEHKSIANFEKGDESLNLINKKIAFKIDVEGHEHLVIKGLNDVLKQNKILLQIEIFDKNFEDVNHLLKNLQFKLITQFREELKTDYIYSNYELA